MNIKELSYSQIQNIQFIESAIKFIHDDKEIIMRGFRHHNIIKDIAELNLTKDYKKSHTDGFIIAYDNEEAFVTRDEGKTIADIKGIELRSNTLTSEDLW